MKRFLTFFLAVALVCTFLCLGVENHSWNVAVAADSSKNFIKYEDFRACFDDKLKAFNIEAKNEQREELEGGEVVHQFFVENSIIEIVDCGVLVNCNSQNEVTSVAIVDEIDNRAVSTPLFALLSNYIYIAMDMPEIKAKDFNEKYKFFSGSDYYEQISLEDYTIISCCEGTTFYFTIFLPESEEPTLDSLKDVFFLESTLTEEMTPKEPVTVGQANALKSATAYLKYSAFSYTGLIEQLEYEGYSLEEASYAAENSGADWNEQAIKSAETYLQYTAFSYKGLIEQLEYEGFTHNQAVYGVDSIDVNWSEQAAKSAETYLKYYSFSRNGLIEQLEYEGFSYEQAVYGVEANGY